MELEIIYQDEHLVAINKPHGLLVHRTNIAADVHVFALQTLRNQIGQRVYPVHRIDRKTGGILLFATSQEIYKAMQKQFATKKVFKKYLAIVRGFTEDVGRIDYPLLNEELNTKQEAVTLYKTIARSELKIAIENHPSSRYSLVEASPVTGRTHQIRRHFRHLRHPIINDRPYGCNKQNRLFKQKWNMTTMFLHAYELKFTDPVSGNEVALKANFSEDFKWALELMGWKLDHDS